MFTSIRARLTLTYIVLICLVMGIISVFLLSILEDYYLEYHRESMENAGNLVAEISRGSMETNPDLVVLSTLAQDMARQIKARIIIADKRGMVLGDSVRVGGFLGKNINRPEIIAALEGNAESSVQYIQESDQRVMLVAVPIVNEEDILGSVLLSSSLEGVFDTLGAIRSFVIIATLIALVLSGFIAALMAKTFTTPIEELTTATRAMAAGDLEQEIPVRNEDEIGQLARQFNFMSSRVMQTNRKLREFVSNASHELRTPLTTINLLVSSLKDYADDEELRDEFFKDIEGETQRLIDLVADLLSLARLEEGGKAPPREEIDLAALVKEVVDTSTSHLTRQGLALDFRQGTMPLPVLANRDELKQVLHNLLDNAMKHTPAGGQILVEVRGGVEEALVRVSDTGSGIPAEDLERVFERFYRVDKARSREKGGTGLGLSICREVIASHNGEIWAESQEGQGSTFYFVLPLDVNKD